MAFSTSFSVVKHLTILRGFVNEVLVYSSVSRRKVPCRQITAIATMSSSHGRAIAWSLLWWMYWKHYYNLETVIILKLLLIDPPGRHSSTVSICSPQLAGLGFYPESVLGRFIYQTLPTSAGIEWHKMLMLDAALCFSWPAQN